MREIPNDSYIDVFDDVEEYMRLLCRRRKWIKQAKKFRRRIKVQFT
jgi:hypothetical protein